MEFNRHVQCFLTLCILVSLFSVSMIPPTYGVKTILMKNQPDETYYTYDQLTDLLYRLKEEYPTIFSFTSLGKTYENRDIWLVKISDHVTIDEEEAQVLYKGGVHGDEKQGYQVVIYSLKAIVENYTSPHVNQSFTTRIRNIVNNTELYFMPMINPDGCEAETRKNRRHNNCPLGKTLLCGVDVNRNSGYKWELLDKYPFKYRRSGLPTVIEKINVKYAFFDTMTLLGEGCYRGPSPFSEPESLAIKQVVEHHNITISIDYHSYGSMILYGWGWTPDPRPDEPLSYYIAQNLSQMTGYKLRRSSDLALKLGRIGDWEYAEHNIMSFGIELPPTKSDCRFSWNAEPLLPMCKTHVLVNVYIAEKAMELVS